MTKKWGIGIQQTYSLLFKKSLKKRVSIPDESYITHESYSSLEHYPPTTWNLSISIVQKWSLPENCQPLQPTDNINIWASPDIALNGRELRTKVAVGEVPGIPLFQVWFQSRWIFVVLVVCCSFSPFFCRPNAGKKNIYIYMYICIYAPAKSNWKPNLRSSQKKRLNMVFFEGNIEQKRRTVGWKIDHIMMDFQLAGVKLIMFRSWTSIQYPYLPHSIGFSSKKNSPTR